MHMRFYIRRCQCIEWVFVLTRALIGAIQELKEALITSNAALSARTDELTKTTQLLVELIRTVQTETSLIPNALKEATSLIPAAIKDASEAGFHVRTQN